MKFTPPSQNRQVNTLSILLFVLAAVCYIVPDMGVVPPIVFQITGMCAVVAGIYVLVRYKFVKFTYIIRPKGDADITDRDIEAYAGIADITTIPAEMLDFAVVKSQGLREGAMECLIGLENLTDVITFTEKKAVRDSVRSKYSGIKIYDYSASMFACKLCALIFRDGEDFICVIIEPDERMTGVFNKLISK